MLKNVSLVIKLKYNLKVILFCMGWLLPSCHSTKTQTLTFESQLYMDQT